MTFFSMLSSIANEANRRMSGLPEGSKERANDCAIIATAKFIGKDIIDKDFFLKRKKAAERIHLALKGIPYASEVLGVSKNSVKNSLYLVSKQLKKRLEGVLELLEQGDHFSASFLYGLKTDPEYATALFPAEIVRGGLLEAEEKSLKSKADFIGCIKLLKSITIRSLEARLFEDFDEDTMSTIMFYLLSDSPQHVYKRLGLYNYLSGEYENASNPEEELIKHMKKK